MFQMTSHFYAATLGYSQNPEIILFSFDEHAVYLLDNIFLSGVIQLFQD
jgi:hypothetical protein